MNQNNSLLNNPETTESRKKIIKRKKLFHQIYEHWYRLLLGDITSPSDNEYIVEIGSGAGFIKETYPYVISTEILDISGVDLVCDGISLPFKDMTIKRFIMIDVLHHVKKPEQFLKEMERCLMPEGLIMMIEPYNTFFGHIIMKYFHHEHFDPNTPEWTIEGNGHLSCANSAMPWIIFSRDREIFNKKFPFLLLDSLILHFPFSYLLSGGFSFPQLIPDFLTGIILKADILISKLLPSLGIFALIQLKKCAGRK